jgi:hypothetical protein
MIIRARLLLFLGLLALGGCATTPTVYRAASAPGAVGYSESPIENDRWRVSFRGGDGASTQQVGDLALQRAADLTLGKGYDWFRVVQRDVEGLRYGAKPSFYLAFGGADFGGGGFGGVGAGVGFDVGGSSRSVTVTLEVLMGHGPAPQDPDAYDAHAVRRSLGASV